MGSLLAVAAAVFTAPATKLLTAIKTLHEEINGRWLIFISVLIRINLKRWTSKKRFDLWNVWKDLGPENAGNIPFPIEWQLERPSNQHDERITIYGVNSSQHFLFLAINWRPQSRTISAQLTFRDIEGNQYDLDLNQVGERLDDGTIYKVGGLKLEVINPFRRITIKYRGLITKTINGQQSTVFAKLWFIWLPISQVVDYTTDGDAKFSSKEITTDYAANILEPQLVNEDAFEHLGHLKGQVRIENEEPFELNLWGSRIKKIIDSEAIKKPAARLCGFNKKGHLFSIHAQLDSKLRIKRRYGLVQWGTGFSFDITNTSFHDFARLANSTSGSEELDFTVECSDRTFKCKGKQFAKSIRNFKLFDIELNGHRGSSMFIFEDLKDFYTQKLSNVIRTPTPPVQTISREISSKSLVLSFSDEFADCEQLSGGKGASLASLLQLSSTTLKTNPFKVPDGLIVTTSSYKVLLEQNPKIHDAIKKLQELFWSKDGRELAKSKSSELVSMIEQAELPSAIKSEVSRKLIEQFGRDQVDSVLFAVRSSAVGEDSEDMSAAGQMTSYLGVKGFEDIYASIMKCWASQFSHVAIEYRRGYGQLIDSSMAVVIQEMVDCDAAGVLFTCDPISGDERRMLITANYGLGESVVSASSEPDTFHVDIEVNGGSRKVLGVSKTVIGSKSSFIKISDASSGGTTEFQQSENSSNPCLTESDLLKLSNVALEVAKSSGNPRDIEFGFKTGTIYLLQSRPVTNLDSPSEFELFHENDAAHSSEEEYNSKANVGEVMPNALSTFNLSYSFMAWNVSFFRRMAVMESIPAKYFIPHASKGIGVAYNNVFFNLKDGGLFKFDEEGKQDMVANAMTLAMFGHEVNDEQLGRDASDRKAPDTTIKTINRIWFLLKEIFLCERRLRSLESQNLTNLFDDNVQRTVEEYLREIMMSTPINYEPFSSHIGITTVSSIYNLVLLLMLDSKSEDKNQLLSDFAAVLSSCNDVISADVPSSLKKIALAISEPDLVKSKSDQEVLDYLENDKGSAGQEFKNFLIKHGHRGLKEFDPFTKVWSDNRIFIASSIKTMLSGDVKSYRIKTEASVDEVLKTLRTPMSGTKLWFLRKFLLPWCRHAVGLREQSKNHLVKVLDLFRKKWWTLANRMSYEEGRLPEPELFFHCTMLELQRLMVNREPGIVARAKLRQRTYYQLDKLKFDEIIIGPEMKPRNSTNFKQLVAGESLKGTPVSAGLIVARVCVAPQLEDAVHLQAGDVLVTYSTDIGWSPYFPMLGGLITEIGGLVSHGAVIAREYGLPCLVGVDGACSVLKSGDRVVLDANSGTIGRVADQSDD